MEKEFCEIRLKGKRVEDGLVFEGGVEFHGKEMEKANILAAVMESMRINPVTMPVVVFQAMQIFSERDHGERPGMGS